MLLGCQFSAALEPTTGREQGFAGGLWSLQSGAKFRFTKSTKIHPRVPY